MQRAALYARTLRLHHWIKNLLVLAPAVFGIRLNESDLWPRIGLGFFAFSFIASVVYVLNDLLDIEKDRAHPKKKSRPIASGKVSRSEAILLVTGLGTLGLGIGYYLSVTVFLCLVGYLVANIVYSAWLKHMAVLDLLVVTGFYIVRVAVGGILADVHISVWLVLTTFFLSLFLVTIKRRQEFLRGTETRKVLEAYSKEFLDALVIISVTSAILFYTLYTTTKHESFVWSVLFVVYGLLRYIYLVLVNNHGEEPEQLITRDKGIWAALLGWCLFVVVYFYYR